MPPILRALPYSDRRSSVAVSSETVEVFPYQIILWAGFASIEELRPAPDAPRFPVILDTGFSGAFAITPNHLRRWAGIEWNTLPFDPTLRLQYQGVDVPHRRGNVWLYPNQYGWRDHIDPLLPPYLLELYGGIAVYGDGEQVGSTATTRLTGPRLPLLGLRAVSQARLQLQIDAATREVWLDSP